MSPACRADESNPMYRDGPLRVRKVWDRLKVFLLKDNMGNKTTEQ